MRSILAAATALFLMGVSAEAKVSIVVDKDSQQMSVSVDGVEKYNWPVSSGLPKYETPNGDFGAFRMVENHFSKEYDDAPMPNAIFFTARGHAIHGTDSVNRLGSPASHGCVRLSRANAKTLYSLVKQEGVSNTTVALTGSSKVALARNPRPNATVARRSSPAYEEIAEDGLPVQRYARGSQDYIYQPDGGPAYLAPRSYRRQAQNVQPQAYYDERGYAIPYMTPSQEPAPRRIYQRRGYMAYQD